MLRPRKLRAKRCTRQMSGFSISGTVPPQTDALSALPLDAVFVVPGDEIFVDHEGGFLKSAA